MIGNNMRRAKTVLKKDSLPHLGIFSGKGEGRLFLEGSVVERSYHLPHPIYLPVLPTYVYHPMVSQQKSRKKSTSQSDSTNFL